MERARPRKGSLCLPTGFEKLRLVLVPLALVAGVWTGVEFCSAFHHTAEAIAVGVLTADIALHVVELLVHALASSRWAWVFALELVAGTASGSVFFLVFDEVGEAIAVGLMTANIMLHVVELLVDVTVTRRTAAVGPGARRDDERATHGIARRTTVRRILERVKRWFTGGFGGFGGPVATAGAR